MIGIVAHQPTYTAVLWAGRTHWSKWRGTLAATGLSLSSMLLVLGNNLQAILNARSRMIMITHRIILIQPTGYVIMINTSLTIISWTGRGTDLHSQHINDIVHQRCEGHSHMLCKLCLTISLTSILGCWAVLVAWVHALVLIHQSVLTSEACKECGHSAVPIT